MKYATLAASAIAIGAGATTGTAVAQESENGDATVTLFGDEYRPGVDFEAVAALNDDTKQALFQATGLTDEFSSPEDWDVYVGTFDVGGSAPVLGHLMASGVDLGDGATLGADASFRNAELNLVETSLGDETGGDGAATLSGQEYPAVDEWLTETEVGAAAPNYDGSIVDRRGQDTVLVDVGAGASGWEFEPAAVAVSPGTTVHWEWTGDGGEHNVEAEPEDQIGESDYEFSSGEPVDEEGETYERSFDESGIALYHCEPHLPDGMKGAIVIAE